MQLPVARSQTPEFLDATQARPELESALAAALQDPGARWIALFGPAGAGKTRLLAKSAPQRRAELPDGYFYVGLSSCGPKEDLASALALDLGLDLRSPADALEQLAYFFSRKRCLLAVDALERCPRSVEDLLKILQASPGLRIVSSSREAPALSELRPLLVPAWQPRLKVLQAAEALIPSQREALTRLALLPGGFGRDCAERSSSLAEIEQLSSLGLLERAGFGRYSLQDTLRQELQAKAAIATVQATQASLGHWVGRVAGNMTRALRGGDQPSALRQFYADKRLFVMAMDHALQAQDLDLARGLAPLLQQGLDLAGWPQQNLALFERAEQALGAQPHAAAAVVKRCLGLSRMSLKQPSLPVLHEALALSERFGSDEEKALARLALAQALNFAGEDEASKEQLALASEAFKSNDNSWGLAWCRYHLAHSALKAGDRGLAGGIFSECLELFRESESLEGQAWVQHGRGMLYDSQGLKREAEKSLRDALQGFSSLGNRTAAAATLVTLAHVTYTRENEDDALALSEAGLVFLKDFRDELGEAWCAFYIADIQNNRGNFAPALERAQMALGSFRKLKAWEGEAWSLALGQLAAMGVGDAERSQKLGEEGLRAFRRAGAIEGQSGCLRGLGRSSFSAGKLDLARKHWEEALGLAVDSQVPWRVMQLAVDFADLAEARSDLHKAYLLFECAAFSRSGLPRIRQAASQGLSRLRPRLSHEEQLRLAREGRALHVEDLPAILRAD